MTAATAPAPETTEGLLARVVARGLPGQADRSLAATPLDDATWRGLLRRANHQRVVGLLVHAVETDAVAVTDAQFAELAELHAAAMAVALELDARLVEAAEALEAADIGFRALKGAAAAHLDYPEPALRQYGDVDVLVPSAQLHEAERTLATLGYARRTASLGTAYERRFGKTVELAGPDGWQIDMHRTLEHEPYGLMIDEAELHAGVTPFVVGGRRIPALDAPRRLVHAAMHASLGNWPPRLVAQRDLASLATRLPEPGEAVALAERWQLGAVLADAVRRAWQLFDLPDAYDLAGWAAERRPTRKERIALDAYQRHDRRHRYRSLATLRVLPGLGARARYAGRIAFPDRRRLEPGGLTRRAWFRRVLTGGRR